MFFGDRTRIKQNVDLDNVLSRASYAPRVSLSYHILNVARASPRLHSRRVASRASSTRRAMRARWARWACVTIAARQTSLAFAFRAASVKYSPRNASGSAGRAALSATNASCRTLVTWASRYAFAEASSRASCSWLGVGRAVRRRGRRPSSVSRAFARACARARRSSHPSRADASTHPSLRPRPRTSRARRRRRRVTRARRTRARWVVARGVAGAVSM